MKIAAVECRQAPAPAVVDNDYGADLRSLNYGFRLAAISNAQFSALD